MMLRPGIAGAAQDPDWSQKTMRDLQHQLDQLRASLGGAVNTNIDIINVPVISAVLVRSMDGTFAPGTTVTGSDFNGTVVPTTVTVTAF